MRQHKQIDSPEAIHDYFQFLLYTLKDSHQLDEKDILCNVNKLMFETVAKLFRMIDGADYTIYVPIEEGETLIRQLYDKGPSRQLLRSLGQYSVSVYRQYFDQLNASGRLKPITDTAGILIDTGFYSRETGLPFTVSEQDHLLSV